MCTISRLATVILFAPVLLQCAFHGNSERLSPQQERNASFELIPTAGYPSIRLIVKDQKTGDVLIGTPIQVLNTTAGALTDQDGQAEIAGVAIGVYDIRVSMVGFHDVILKHVAVIEGYTTDVGEIKLLRAKIRLERVTVY